MQANWLPLVAIIVMLTGTARAGMEEARSAFASGDYETALQEYRPLAEVGDAEAQHALGVMYEKGHGINKDEAIAAEWHQLAAEQGYANAQYSLAFMYLRGMGVSQDYPLAFMWLSLAAEEGHEIAIKRIDAIAGDMTANQREKAEKLLAEWRAAH